METLNFCPICEKNNTVHFLTAIDHFLTKEKFTIVRCQNCGFKFLNPRPAKSEIFRYYNSEEYISHDAEKKSFFSMFYKVIRKSAIKDKYRILRTFSSGNNVLDIGCGTGEFLSQCRLKGMTVCGIEPNDKARNYAGTVNNIPVYEESELEKLQGSSFDIITMWHVLEHVHNLNERIQKIGQLLKPDGILIIAVPNSNSWDAIHYQDAWAAYDPPRHLYHFNSDTIQLLAKKNNFILEKILPLKWDAFYISLLSEKYARGTNSFVRATINGLRSNFYASGPEKNYSSQIFILKAGKTAK